MSNTLRTPVANTRLALHYMGNTGGRIVVMLVRLKRRSSHVKWDPQLLMKSKALVPRLYMPVKFCILGIVNLYLVIYDT
jgi:hypothetical protein